mmetsp:Transcript_15473/g.36541  ORF Transcript_15473/g.36541 Transcript_15473/m.36541 type:complete len:152 (-) Transcript_15473:210-665(-)
MAEVDEFEDGEAKPEDKPAGSDRKAQALMKRQMVDDVSVAAFAQLGTDFFAAARARLAQSRDESGEPTVGTTRARHQRLVEDARQAASRGQWDLDGKQSLRENADDGTRLEAERLARLDAKRKRQADEVDKDKVTSVRRGRLSFAGDEDDI